MFVAGNEAYTADSATAAVASYAERYGATIEHYDLGGPNEIDVDDAVSAADIGRMVFINAKLDGDDAAQLVRFNLATYLAPLSIDLRFEDIDLDPRGSDRTYAAMESAWTALKALPKIKNAKASKLLHLKRPNLFPIIDRDVKKVYDKAAGDAGRSVGSPVAHYWLAIAADVRANASGTSTSGTN